MTERLIHYMLVGNRRFVTQTDLALLTGRNRQWLNMLTRMGLLKSRKQVPGRKARYYDVDASLKVLEQFPSRKERTNGKHRRASKAI